MRDPKTHKGFPVFKYITGVILVMLAVILMAMLHGCESPVTTSNQPAESPKTQPTATTTDGKTIFIVDSTWHIVTMDKLSTSLFWSMSRTTTMENYIAAVDAYNASSIDDYLRIYYDSVPAIEDSPVVDVFIVNPETWHRNMELLGILRTSLVENVAAWRRDSAGQLLFIDHVPPPPIITPPASMYAHYAIYEVDNATGAIILEDHCGYLPDESFAGQWITTLESQGGGGWSSVDAYYLTTLHAYQADCNDGLHRVITRQLYTPPVTP